MKLEDGRGILTLHGLAGDAPPGDRAGLLEFARAHKTPLLADTLAGLRDPEPITRTGSTKNRLRHFERAALPVGLFVLGDAVCTLNPVYGQGMSLAALGAELLGEVLDRAPDLAVATARFARAYARRLFFPWTVATSEDFRFATTRGRRPPGLGAFHAYLDRLFARGTRDPATAAKLERVILLIDSPAGFVAPRLVIDTLRDIVRREPAAPFEAVPHFNA
jgi:2-polyprenyl-6-methoxyphenol hydroxylase-like FAD-dependent oxidoreductase